MPSAEEQTPPGDTNDRTATLLPDHMRPDELEESFGGSHNPDCSGAVS